MPFDCWLYLTDVRKDGEAEYERYVTLPFVPIAGMMITFDQETAMFFLPDKIEYYFPEDVFWLTEIRGDDTYCPCGPEDNCCVVYTEDYVAAGWSLIKVARGYDRMHHYAWMFDSDKWFMTAGREVRDVETT